MDSTGVSRTVWRWREAEAEAQARAGAAARDATRLGLFQGAVAIAVAMVLRWAFHRPVMAGVLVVLGTSTALLAVASPSRGYAALLRAIRVVGDGLGSAVRWLLMPLVFYGLFLPFGWWRRLTGKAQRTVPRSPDRAVESYWKPSLAPAPGAEPYRRQF